MENAYFTELVEHSPKVLAQFSPKGHAVATAFQSQLHIWDVNLNEISNRFECDIVIDFIKWSPDSELICCGTLKDGMQVWSLEASHWRCKISGCLSFANIHWAPDSRHLFVVSEFHIKITVFSLASSVVTEIDNPKAIENGIIFTPCEKYLIVAHRLNLEDNIGIYSCDNWESIKIFPVETKDMVGLSYSPSDFVIGILESALEECRVMFYSTDGRLLGKYISEASFGLTSLNWSPLGNIVAVGDCLGEVIILDPSNYEFLTSFQHPDIINSTDVILYKASERSALKSPSEMTFSSVVELDEIVKSRPMTLLPASPDSEKWKNKNYLKYGVQTLQFSSDGKYIASITSHMPKVVFIYNVKTFKPYAVIVRRTNIKCVSWHPEEPHLLICSSSNILDVWTPNSCIRHITPFINEFPVSNAAWSPRKDCIILNSKDHFSVLHLQHP